MNSPRGDAILSESDMIQLQREYRNMELNRKAYADDTIRVIRRQSSVIEKLQKENDDLKRETSYFPLQLTERSLYQQHDELREMQEQLDRVQKKTSSEQQKLDTYLEKIQALNQKVLEKSKCIGGVHASKDNHALAQKQSRMLEKRLHTSLARFNEKLAQNKELRLEIEILRRERDVACSIHQKLEKEYTEKKRQMAEALEMSNAAYEQRDAIQQQIRDILDRNQIEAQMHRNELTVLQEKLNQASTEAYKKFSIAIEPESIMKQTMHLDLSNITNRDCHDISKDSSRSNLSVLHSSRHWNSVLGSLPTRFAAERVREQERAIASIKESTGVHDIEELLETFANRENEIFLLYNRVNTRAEEIESLEQQIAELQHQEEQLEDLRKLNNQDSMHDERYETRIHATEEVLNRYEDKAATLQASIEIIQAKMEAIFEKHDCALIKESITENKGLESVLLQFAAAIEVRASFLLEQHASQRAEKGMRRRERSTRCRLREQIGYSSASDIAIKKSHASLTVLPPELDDCSSGEEENNARRNRVLSREELVLRAVSGYRKPLTLPPCSDRKGKLNAHKGNHRENR